MDNPLIHIGYHKTGTTWLQSHLFVDGHPVFHPVSATAMGPSTWAENLYVDENMDLLNAFDLNEKVIASKLSDLLQAKPLVNDKIAVVSHERLSGNPHSAAQDALSIATRIQNCFPKARIFISIREQASFILSSYLQYLSVGGTFGLQKYLLGNKDAKIPGFSPNHMKYDLLIARYQELFGEENVLVLPYELFERDKSQYFQFFREFLEVDFEVDDKLFDQRMNTATAHFLSYRLRFLNVFLFRNSLNHQSNLELGVAGRRLVRSLVRCLNFFVPDSLDNATQDQLRKEIDLWVADRFHESNVLTNSLIECDLTEFNYGGLT